MICGLRRVVSGSDFMYFAILYKINLNHVFSYTKERITNVFIGLALINISECKRANQ